MRYLTIVVLSSALATLWIAPVALAGQSAGKAAPDSPPAPHMP